MANTYFDMSEVEAKIEEKVNELGSTLETKITQLVEPLTTDLSSLTTAVDAIEEKLGIVEE